MPDSNLLLLMLFSVLLLAFAGSALPVLFCKTAELASGKLFYNHLGRQLAWLSVIVGTLAAIMALFLLLCPLAERDTEPRPSDHVMDSSSAHANTLDTMWMRVNALSTDVFFAATSLQSVLFPHDTAGETGAANKQMGMQKLTPQTADSVKRAAVGFIAAFAVCIWLTAASWKKLRKTKMQILLPLATSACATCAVIMTFGAFEFLTLSGLKTLCFNITPWLNSALPPLFPGTPELGSGNLIDQILAPSQVVQPMVLAPSFFQALASIISSVASVLAVSGALACCWLLLRRNADDYGRDYYSFALPVTARITVYPALISLLAQFFLYGCAVINGSDIHGLAFGAVSVLLFLMAYVAMFIIMRSKNPMRHKPGCAIALLLLLAGTTTDLLQIKILLSVF